MMQALRDLLGHAFEEGWEAHRKSTEPTPEQRAAMDEAGRRFREECLRNPHEPQVLWADGEGI